ncbi:receptor-like protein Cf-9 [Capsicum annuum]|uniref:receptor-like protein Cf-9 n=1 Tax=Capsicum annuum TaxID=4072 RepID=UPI001FB10D04|nr:receptor-like protein Cf-9 [Capsicum annuum]
MGYTIFISVRFCFCLLPFSSSIPHPCRKDQSISLLKFKQTLTIDHLTAYNCNCQKPYTKMSSWNMSRDCCSWVGVIHDEMTGHVVELDLHCSQHFGVINSNSSLFQLSHLKKLDLSYNYFYGSHISAKFDRKIPSEISHLFKLQSVRHLSTAHYTLSFKAHDFKLLPQDLNHLRELHLYEVNISSTSPLNFSSHLTTLTLGGTGLYGIIPESYLTSQQYLSLTDRSLRGPIPESLSNLTSIESLFLSQNSLNGTIPSGMFSFPSLIYLRLNNNHFSGQVDDFKSNY